MYKHRGTHIHALLGGHYSLEKNVPGTGQKVDTLRYTVTPVPMASSYVFLLIFLALGG